jgi:hypothetical protein
MPARRELTMRQLRQMLRLHHDGVSARESARTLGVARTTIQDNLARARAAGLGWPLPAECSVGQDGIPAFTKFGIECLEEIISRERAAGRAPPRTQSPK